MYGVQATLASANQEQPERAATWVNVLVAAGRADVACLRRPRHRHGRIAGLLWIPIKLIISNLRDDMAVDITNGLGPNQTFWRSARPRSFEIRRRVNSPTKRLSTKNRSS
jgi:hypothetical protein